MVHGILEVEEGDLKGRNFQRLRGWPREIIYPQGHTTLMIIKHTLTNNLCCGVNQNKQIVVISDQFKMFSFKRTSMAVIQLSSIYNIDNPSTR